MPDFQVCNTLQQLKYKKKSTLIKKKSTQICFLNLFVCFNTAKRPVTCHATKRLLKRHVKIVLIIYDFVSLKNYYSTPESDILNVHKRMWCFLKLSFKRLYFFILCVFSRKISRYYTTRQCHCIPLKHTFSLFIFFVPVVGLRSNAWMYGINITHRLIGRTMSGIWS